MQTLIDRAKTESYSFNAIEGGLVMEEGDYRITVSHEYDQDGDPTDWLGHFSNSPKNDDSIVFEDAPYEVRRNFGGGDIYFNPENPDHAEEDAGYLAKFYTGDECLLGLIVELEKRCPCCDTYKQVDQQAIWSVEGSADSSYVTELVYDLLSELREPEPTQA